HGASAPRGRTRTAATPAQRTRGGHTRSLTRLGAPTQFRTVTADSVTVRGTTPRTPDSLGAPWASDPAVAVESPARTADGRKSAQAVTRAAAPASTGSTVPVICALASSARYSTARVTSKGSRNGTGCACSVEKIGSASARVGDSRSGRIFRYKASFCAIGVAILPGATTFAVTPCGARSSATLFVIPITPHFDAQ